MTLVCCTLTEKFSLISGDTHVTNENGESRIDKKVLKYEDILIGGAGSGGLLSVIPQIIANYKKGTAYKHMKAVANLFRGNQENVFESKYSQFIY